MFCWLSFIKLKFTNSYFYYRYTWLKVKATWLAYYSVKYATLFAPSNSRLYYIKRSSYLSKA